MILMLAVSGLAEGVSVATLVPLLEMTAAGKGGEPSLLSEAVTALLGIVGLRPSLPILLGLIVLGISVKASFLWLAMRQVGFTVARVTQDLRLRLVRAVLGARWRYYGEQPVGRFANAISSEAIRAASAYREACVVMAFVLQIAMYFGISLMISLPGTLLALVGGGTFLLTLRGFVQMSREAGERQTERTKSVTENLADALQGIKPIKAMAREGQFLPLFEKQLEDLHVAHRSQVVASEGLKLFQEPVIAVLLAFGLYGALATGTLAFSSVLVMAFVFYRLMQYVNSLQMRYQVMATGESAFWSLMSEIERAEAEREEAAGDRPPPLLETAVEFEDVWFRYEEEWVLRGLHLRLPHGRFVTIAGPSGAGKSTVADLLMGLHQPHRGRIRVDGVPLDEVDIRAWRWTIGYVPQEVLLLHDTIRRNITLGDDSISDERVVEALRAADAWSFVRLREGGLDAMIGERGSRMSGGQRQRLAIARALVVRPRLLILDEATASLDPQTELAICATLRALRGRLTVVSISHQPAMREAADRVVELEAGQVVGGQPAEVGARDPCLGGLS